MTERYTAKPGEALFKRLKPVDLALISVIILGTALRVYRLAEPFGGFHAFNEAFYFQSALGYLKRGLLSALTSPGDFNNPPLYAVLLAISLKIFGASEAAARGVSVAASALTILFAYKLGKVLYNEKIGLLASAIFAFMPGDALVGRNVQLESSLLLFTTASAYYYVLGLRKDSPVLAGLSGGLLGIGTATKLPAVLSIPAVFIWESWRRKGLHWLRDRKTWAFAAGFAALGWPWYAYQFAINRANFIGAQSHLASTFNLPDAFFLKNFFAVELFWMLSPPLFVAFIGSCFWMIYKRQPADVLILLLIAANLLFYAFYNFHTYYLIQIATFGAVAIARGLYSLRITSWRGVFAAAAALSAVSFFFAFLLLSGQKYGRISFSELESGLGMNPSKVTIKVSKDVMDNWGPVLNLYVTRAKLINQPPAAGESPRKGDAVFVLDRVGSGGQGLVAYSLLTEKRFRLVLFGYAFSQNPPMIHFFTNGSLTVDKVGGPLKFGVDSVDSYSPFAVYIPSPK